MKCVVPLLSLIVQCSMALCMSLWRDYFLSYVVFLVAFLLLMSAVNLVN